MVLLGWRWGVEDGLREMFFNGEGVGDCGDKGDDGEEDGEEGILGKGVCVVERDMGLGNVDVVMGVENRMIYDLVDVVEEGWKMDEGVVKDKGFDDLVYLVGGGERRDKWGVLGEEMVKVMEEVKEELEYIVIEWGGGIEEGYKNGVWGGEKGIVVTRGEMWGVGEGERIMGLVEKEENIVSW